MQYFKASVLAALIASVQALQVNEPAKDAKVDLSKETKVTWTSVSSDPTSFSIQLVNFGVSPTVTKDIADDVQTSAGSFTIPPQKDIANGGTYQVNLVSKTPQNQGILAQSQQFTVTGSASDSSSNSAAASASASASSAASSATSAAGSAASAASSSAAAASSAASSAVSSAGSAASSAVSSAGAAATSAAADNAAASLHLASGVAGLGFVGAAIALFA